MVFRQRTRHQQTNIGGVVCHRHARTHHNKRLRAENINIPQNSVSRARLTEISTTITASPGPSSTAIPTTIPHSPPTSPSSSPPCYFCPHLAYAVPPFLLGQTRRRLADEAPLAPRHPAQHARPAYNVLDGPVRLRDVAPVPDVGVLGGMGLRTSSSSRRRRRIVRGRVVRGRHRRRFDEVDRDSGRRGGGSGGGGGGGGPRPLLSGSRRRRFVRGCCGHGCCCCGIIILAIRAAGTEPASSTSAALVLAGIGTHIFLHVHTSRGLRHVAIT